MTLRSQTGLPRGGRQLGDFGDRPLWQLGQDVEQVGAHVDLEPAAGFHDREDGGDRRSRLLISDMQPVAASQRAPLDEPRMTGRLAG